MLAIRGTLSFDDILTDVAAVTVPFPSARFISNLKSYQTLARSPRPEGPDDINHGISGSSARPFSSDTSNTSNQANAPDSLSPQPKRRRKSPVNLQNDTAPPAMDLDDTLPVAAASENDLTACSRDGDDSSPMQIESDVFDQDVSTSSDVVTGVTMAHRGWAHGGMAEAADWLLQETLPSLCTLARQGYRIRLTGHSLGAGCATLLGGLSFLSPYLLLMTLILSAFDIHWTLDDI